MLELSDPATPPRCPAIGALQDPDAEVRLQAAKGLEEYDEPDAATALAAALADENGRGEAAAYSLSEFKT